jgi:hypothetical protein
VVLDEFLFDWKWEVGLPSIKLMYTFYISVEFLQIKDAFSTRLILEGLYFGVAFMRVYLCVVNI